MRLTCFWLELTLALILPLALLTQKKSENDSWRTLVTAVLVVLGFITNRLNVSITGLEGSAGALHTEVD